MLKHHFMKMYGGLQLYTFSNFEPDRHVVSFTFWLLCLCGKNLESASHGYDGEKEMTLFLPGIEPVIQPIAIIILHCPSFLS